MSLGEYESWVRSSKIPRLKSFSPQLFWAAFYAEEYSKHGKVVLIEISVTQPSDWTTEVGQGCGPNEVRSLVDLPLVVIRDHDYECVFREYFSRLDRGENSSCYSVSCPDT